MKIQSRIVIPFTLLFVVSTLITAVVAIRLMTATVQARQDTQMADASRMMARVEFAMNASILKNLKEVLSADVVTYTRSGDVLASTLSEGDGNLLAAIQAPEAARRILDEGEEWVVLDARPGGTPYRIGYRRVVSREGAILAVAVSEADVLATQSNIARTVFVIAAIIVLAMSLMGHIVAKSVTGPVLKLVNYTKAVAAGEVTVATRWSGSDEVGELTTAFSKMVERLQQSKAELIRSEKLAVAGLFAARVAHDVRNPLSAIKMQAQMLRSRLQPGADNAALLQAILQEIDRVEWVIQDLLELATPQELRIELRRVEDVLDETLQQSEHQLRHRKINVQRDYDAATPPLPLDPRRFRLALLNLIFNAAEAMPNGGNLTVRTRHERDRGAVAVEIVDDGIGIDSSVRDRLFAPFVTTKPEGVGLGLVSAKNIVDKHHGTVALEAAEPRGARAVIRLRVEPKEPQHG